MPASFGSSSSLVRFVEFFTGEQAFDALEHAGLVGVPIAGQDDVDAPAEGGQQVGFEQFALDQVALGVPLQRVDEDAQAVRAVVAARNGQVAAEVRLADGSLDGVAALAQGVGQLVDDRVAGLVGFVGGRRGCESVRRICVAMAASPIEAASA